MPLARTRSEEFDDLILDAVEDLERSWATELADVEFAVEDVPPVPARIRPPAWRPNSIPRSSTTTACRSAGWCERRTGLAHPVIVIYRRPLESRAIDRDDRADLVFSVVAELVAEALGKDVDEIDPPR